MPPNEKSYIITPTSRGLGMSRVPVTATARSHSTMSRRGNPAPSATVVIFSITRERRRTAAGTSAMAGCVACASAVTCSLTAMRYMNCLVTRWSRSGIWRICLFSNISLV